MDAKIRSLPISISYICSVIANFLTDVCDLGSSERIDDFLSSRVPDSVAMEHG